MNNLQLNTLEIIIRNWNGFEIEFEMVGDQLMANATKMCAAFGKRPIKWLELDSTKRHIQAKEAKSDFRTLVETRQGGSAPGTWIHEKLILKLAQWLDVDFEIQCDEWVAELLRTGKVELQPLAPQPVVPATYIEALRAFADALEEKQQLQLSNEQKTLLLEAASQQKEELTTVLQQTRPLADFATTMMQAPNEFSVADAAKKLGYGEKKLFTLLRDKGVLLSSKRNHNLPAQPYIDKGQFRVVTTSHTPEQGPQAGKTLLTMRTVVTAKGLFYLWKGLIKLGVITKKWEDVEAKAS